MDLPEDQRHCLLGFWQRSACMYTTCDGIPRALYFEYTQPWSVRLTPNPMAFLNLMTRTHILSSGLLLARNTAAFFSQQTLLVRPVRVIRVVLRYRATVNVLLKAGFVASVYTYLGLSSGSSRQTGTQNAPHLRGTRLTRTYALEEPDTIQSGERNSR